MLNATVRYVAFRLEGGTLVVTTWWRQVCRHLLDQKATHLWSHFGYLVSVLFGGVPVSQAVPCVPALADGPSRGCSQKWCCACLCLLGLSWLQASRAISLLVATPVFSFTRCSAIQGLSARQVVTITWDPYPRAPVSEGVAPGGGRARSSFASSVVGVPAALAGKGLVIPTEPCSRGSPRLLSSGRDSLSQEFVAGRSWWRFVAPCVSSSLFEFIAYLTGLNSNPSGSSDPLVAARPSGVPGGGPEGQVVTVVSELRSSDPWVAARPSGVPGGGPEGRVVTSRVHDLRTGLGRIRGSCGRGRRTMTRALHGRIIWLVSRSRWNCPMLGDFFGIVRAFDLFRDLNSLLWTRS
ncbi:hypothetical protein Taro_019458, partial [Colocasia esculenta]|nr:hypothetical protein [Colocasia esculenta]